MDLELSSPLAGWCLPLTSVPDAVFADGIMGPGVAIDPTGDTLHAPCDGTVLTIHAARHALTLRAATGVEMLIHLGMDTVALGGRGFDTLVSAGEEVRAGDPLIRFDLDALVSAGHPVVTPVIVTDEALSVTPLAIGRAVAVGERLLTIVGTGRAPAVADAAGGGFERTLTVELAHGLHARPAARIAAALRGLDAHVTLMLEDRSASAASSVALLGLSAGCGAKLSARAGGRQSIVALDRIAALLRAEAEDAGPVPIVRPAATAGVPEGALSGIAAAPGLVIGAAWPLHYSRIELPEAGEGPSAERVRLAAALAAVGLALDGEADGSGAAIAAAHRTLLDDPDLRAAAEAGIAAGLHAATAFRLATDAQAAGLRRSGNRRIAERADDLDDLGARVARAALGVSETTPDYPAGAILVAQDLLPSQLLDPRARTLGGIVLGGGGATSHVAILAAGLGIPMVVALGETIGELPEGATLIVDGDAGAVQPSPDDAALAEAERRIALRRAEAAAAREAGGRGMTRDGTAVAVLANIASAEDAQAAVREGAEGSGLLRTEFLFLDRADPPGVEEQADCYRRIVDALGGRPLTIRLLDVGGDKAATYLRIPPEENPALGERGVRVLLARPALLDAQLRAIVAGGAGRAIRIMVPMVAALDELASVRATLHRVAREVGTAAPPLGVMIETPAAALVADRLAEEADFLSIGSNDLTQYALAMDRGNPAVAAAADGLHPAVLRLIDLTCRGAERRDVSVGLCGGLAADPLAVPILLGLGVRSLSVPPARVAATRALVARLEMGHVQGLAQRALACAGAADVRALMRHDMEERR